MSGCQEAAGDLVSEKRTVEEATSRHNAPQRRSQTLLFLMCACLSVCTMPKCIVSVCLCVCMAWCLSVCTVHLCIVPVCLHVCMGVCLSVCTMPKCIVSVCLCLGMCVYSEKYTCVCV